MEWFNLLGLGGRTPLAESALLLGLFWAALSHPEKIRSVLLFRIASLLLGLSIFSPIVVQMLWLGNQAGRAGQGLGAGQFPGIETLVIAVPPFLTMLAVLFGLGSITPQGKPRS